MCKTFAQLKDLFYKQVIDMKLQKLFLSDEEFGAVEVLWRHWKLWKSTPESSAGEMIL